MRWSCEFFDIWMCNFRDDISFLFRRIAAHKMHMKGFHRGEGCIAKWLLFLESTWKLSILQGSLKFSLIWDAMWSLSIYMSSVNNPFCRLWIWALWFNCRNSLQFQNGLKDHLLMSKGCNDVSFLKRNFSD